MTGEKMSGWEKLIIRLTAVVNKTICIDIEHQKKKAESEIKELLEVPENYKKRLPEFELQRLIENTFSTEKANRIMVVMTLMIVFLTIATLLVVCYQTSLSKKSTDLALQQNKIVLEERQKMPVLDAKFISLNKISENVYSYEFRIENSGTKSAHGAYVHLWVPNDLEFKVAGINQGFPAKNEPNAMHYEWHIVESILKKRNVIIGQVFFVFKNPNTRTAKILYLIAGDEIDDRTGEFVITRPAPTENAEHKSVPVLKVPRSGEPGTAGTGT